ncbi:MAG: TraQ conjugal transfer family protein, partial [Algibacter sp.]
MKKIYIPLVVTCMSIVLFFTCTKDVDVQFSFPFEIVETHDVEATINYGTPIQVQIIPERIVQDHIYRFKYTVLEGEGFLRYANQDPLLEDTFHLCELLEIDFEFIGTELGDCKIEFTVEDIEGLTETILINYEVIHSPFNMDVNTTSTELVIGKNTPVVFRLENTGENDSVTYETSISFQQGSGTIYKTNDIGESTFEITPNTYFPVAEGLQFYNVVLDETGESTILFQIRDSNGQLKEENLSFNTDVIDFTYIGAPQQNVLFLGESTNLNFEINELLHGGDVYESRYEINSGNAVIRRTIDNIEDVLSPGINYPVDANAYYWEIQPLEAGTVDITFFAKNVSGTEKELQISIDVSNGVFEFQATNTINFASVNDDVLVNFLITETGPQEPPYTMVFESSSNGVLEIEGLIYNPGELIPIEHLNFIGNYKGLINGKHDVLFKVTNSLNEAMEDDFSITFNEESFIFTAIAEKSNIYVNDNTNINFNISEDTDDATYEMYYTVSGSGNSSLTSGHIHFSAGTFYEVLNGSFSWDVNALSEGNLTYTFYVSNNSDFVQSQVVDFTINPIPINDFNFTAISSANTATTGEKIPVNFNITETEGNSTYTMVFTSTDEGTFDYNGITYNQGEPIAVTSGNFTGSYNGSVSGAHQVVFTVTNANAIPISHSNDMAITFDNIDFNLSTTGDSSLYVGNSENINLYLTQVQNDENITYAVVYSFNSNSAGGGEIKSDDNTSIILGQSYPISPGNSSTSFKATQIGLVIIDITVTDSNNISHTSQVTFDAENIDFTFSGAPQQNTIETGETTNLNFNINEAVTSGASYQMKYEILSGNGNVKDGGTTQAVNTYYNVNTDSYSWEFESTDNGTVELLFTALNTTTNVTQTQAVTIMVIEPPVSDFSFTTISSANTATVGESVPINLNITETVGSSTYGMVFTSTGTGTFDYNGIT